MYANSHCQETNVITMRDSMISFTASGHKNLLAAHRTTLEFTKENYLTKKGDCILGINATFSLEEIRQELKKGKIKITIETNNSKDELFAEYNPCFKHPEQMVIRTSNYRDDRTFAINATKAAKDIKRELVEELKSEESKVKIYLKQA